MGRMQCTRGWTFFASIGDSVEQNRGVTVRLSGFLDISVKLGIIYRKRQSSCRFLLLWYRGIFLKKVRCCFYDED